MTAHPAPIPSGISLTAQDAISKARQELNVAMVEFDRWIAQNPQITVADEEYQLRQQQVKLLRLRINELQDLSNAYANTLIMLRAEAPAPSQIHVVRPRTGQIAVERVNNRLAKRRCNRISQGPRSNIP